MNKNILDISVIIPFHNHPQMTISAVLSLVKFGPAVQEILLVSNNSSKDSLKLIEDRVLNYTNIRLVEYNHPFNYQKMNNWAVKQTKASFILFMNNDIELVEESRGLIEKMSSTASKENVGIVGCLLLYGDQVTIQHAGVFLMPRGTADHVYVGKKLKYVQNKVNSKSIPYDPRQTHRMSAVTGAVSLVERVKFLEVGGFDERFIICGGDIDLCLRLNQRGYQTVYTGEGYIIHKESQSRAHKPIPYSDFYYSYLSYIRGYDKQIGDPFLSLITKDM